MTLYEPKEGDFSRKEQIARLMICYFILQRISYTHYKERIFQFVVEKVIFVKCLMIFNFEINYIFIFFYTFDRVKRYYSIQNLTELFNQKGLNPDELILGEEQGELPLYVFDDKLFETRTPSQW